MESVILSSQPEADEWGNYGGGGARLGTSDPNAGRRQEVAMDLARKTRIRVQSQHIRKIVVQRAYVQSQIAANCVCYTCTAHVSLVCSNAAVLCCAVSE